MTQRPALRGCFSCRLRSVITRVRPPVPPLARTMRQFPYVALLSCLVLLGACLEPERAAVLGGPDASGNPCTLNTEIRCNDTIVEQCVANTWTPIFACPAPYVCESQGCVCPQGCAEDQTCGTDGCGMPCGACEPGEVCDLYGKKTCIQASSCTPDCSGRQCGDDGCGGSCGDCASDTACISDNTSAACEVGKTCGDILSCFVGCVSVGGGTATLESCQSACLIGSSADVQQSLSYVASCIDAEGCKDLACVGDNCAIPFASCAFNTAGSKSCSEVWQCVAECPLGDPECAPLCTEGGDSDAMAYFSALTLCIATECPLSIPGDACTEKAITSGACLTPYENCSAQR